MKLLIVDDEENTVRFLHQGLTEEGFVVDVARNDVEADLAVFSCPYDTILLDVMLPGQDGYSLCRHWRQSGIQTPIIFLSARGTVQDRVLGLELGADDYLPKPFAFEELLARLRARLRRAEQPVAPPILEIGDLSIDPSSRTVSIQDQTLELTLREYLVLECLARNAGQVVTRAQLWEQAWETGLEPSSNAIEVYIGYLRQKLGPLRPYLQTVRGIGYRLSPD